MENKFEYTHEQIEEMTETAEFLSALCHLEIDRRQRFLEMLDKFDPLLDTIGAWFISQMGPK